MVIEHKGRKGARSKYKEPEQKFSNQEVAIKLFCHKDRCNNYIKGTLGYNGAFTCEDGDYSDLRNQVWYCTKHDIRLLGKITRDQLSIICRAFHKWMRTCDNQGTAKMYKAIDGMKNDDYALAMADALKEAGINTEGY